MTKNTSVRRGLSVLAAACLAVGAAGVITMPAAHAATPTSAAEAAMVPTPLTRIVDSREAVGVAKAPANNEVLQIQVTGEVDTVAGATKAKKTVVPKGASAVVLNMTAVEAKSAGYFTAWQNGQARPSTSNINFMAGDIVANGAVVPLDSDGKISVFARGSADILLDIAGYYRADSYTAATPSRYFDSRLTADGSVGARSITRVDVGDEGELVTLNITADGAKAGGYITAWPTVEDATTVKTPSIAGMPQTSNLNYAEGQTVANTVQVVAGKNGYVSLFSLAETNLIVDKVKGIKKTLAANETCANANDATEYMYCATVLSNPAERVMDTRVNLGSDKKTGYRALNLMSLVGTDYDALGSIVLNITVADPKADGFIAIGPDLEAKGVSTSVLNYKAGQVMANRVTIPASFAGELQVYSHSETDVIVDVLGYTKAPALTGTDVPANAKLDLSKAKASKAFTSSATTTLYNLSNKSAIAIPVETSATATGLINDATNFWVLDGTSVTVKDSAGKETSVDVLASGATSNVVPLAGMTAGEYTLSFPLKDNQASPNTQKATYSIDFTIAPGAGATGEVWGAERAFTFANNISTAGSAKLTISGTPITITTSNGQTPTQVAAAFVTAINADTTLAGKGIIASSDTGVLSIKKVGSTTALAAADVAFELTTSTATTMTPGAESMPAVDVDYTLDNTSLPRVPLGNSTTNEYAGPTAATAVTNGAKLEVKLPSGFNSTPDSVSFKLGTKTVTGSVTENSNVWTVDMPSRSAIKSAGAGLTGTMTATIKSGGATANTVSIPITIQ